MRISRAQCLHMLAVMGLEESSSNSIMVMVHGVPLSIRISCQHNAATVASTERVLYASIKAVRVQAKAPHERGVTHANARNHQARLAVMRLEEHCQKPS